MVSCFSPIGLMKVFTKIPLWLVRVKYKHNKILQAAVVNLTSFEHTPSFIIMNWIIEILIVCTVYSTMTHYDY